MAAQAHEEPDVLRVGTQLVQVNVVVTDDDGPVHDLTADDFTVLDDGVVRRIEVFEVIRSETGDSDPAAMLPDRVASNRLDRRGRRPESATIVLVDRVNTLGRDQAFMDGQVRAFLDGAADAGEHVAVLELGDAGLTVLADFTSHPEAIRNALEGRRPSHSLAMESSVGFFTGGLDPVLAALACEPYIPELANCDQDDAEAPPANGEFLRQAAVYFMNRRILVTVAALEASARRLSTLPGRKNLVWMAAQFPFPYRAWEDVRFTQSQRHMPPSTLNRVEDVFRVIVDSDVAVYPIDVMGLRHPESITDTQVDLMGRWVPNSTTALNFAVDLPMKIAEVTGGRASFNTNGLATRMREAVRDMYSSYSLGFYVPEVESDSGFHEIEVRIDRDDVEVLHRNGYFGFGASPPAASDVRDALEDPFDAPGIGLLATANPVPNETGRFTVTLALDVNDVRLTRNADHWSGSVEIAMSFYIPSLDEYRNPPPVRHEIRLTEAQFRTAERLTSLVIPEVVETEGLSGHLRVAVQDPATGETGSLWLNLGDE